MNSFRRILWQPAGTVGRRDSDDEAMLAVWFRISGFNNAQRYFTIK